MGDILKTAVKKACKHGKHQLAKQTLPNIQLATKLAPVAAMSLPVLSNIATSATTIMTGTMKTVAELDAKKSMEQR